MSDFPSSKYERGKIFARTGIRVGTNYAKHYLKRSMKRNGEKAKVDDELNDLHGENAREVFKEFSKLRGTALKIAQSLSMDQGLMPEAYTEVLSQAQYKVPPINKALVRTIIKRELGDYPEKIFDKFEPEAFAAASIGQVHRAWLKDGRKVAVKIQYPNVRDTINTDLRMARLLLKRIIKGDNLDQYIDEVAERLMEETDYQHEGKQIERFAQHYNTERYVTPRWIKELSTQKVLTMSFVEGRHMKEFLAENPSQERRNHFGQLMWDFFHDQIKSKGPIHADTHPGNFLFLENGKLGIIDFGCVKSFPTRFYYDYLKLLPLHMEQDLEQIRELYIDLEMLHRNPKNPEKEEEFFKFCKQYGDAFSEPYLGDQFDFGDESYRERMNYYAQELPMWNEARGSRHFLYSTRVHLGLYSLLMRLKAQIDTAESRQIALRSVDTDQIETAG